jgi:hypothetical protein
MKKSEAIKIIRDAYNEWNFGPDIEGYKNEYEYILAALVNAGMKPPKVKLKRTWKKGYVDSFWGEIPTDVTMIEETHEWEDE